MSRGSAPLARNDTLPNSRRRCFLAFLFAVFFATNLVQAAIYQYTDKQGRRVFTNECNAEQVKAGCKEVTLKERPRLSLEEEKRLRALVPGSEQSDQYLKEARQQSSIEVRQRNLRADINGDGRVTISDLPGWIKWIFYYPGDWLVLMLSERSNKLVDFLELRATNHSAAFNLIVSVSFWLAVIVLCFGLKRVIKKFRARPRYT